MTATIDRTLTVGDRVTWRGGSRPEHGTIQASDGLGVLISWDAGGQGGILRSDPTLEREAESGTLPEQPVQAAVQTAMMTAEEARAAAGKIRLSVGDLRRMLLDFEQRRGYRALGYQNMRLCAEHEFGWPKSQFYRQLKAIDIERSVGVAIGDMPESHARELARLPAAERADAYKAAGVGATAADVRREVDRRRQQPEPETLPETEPPDYSEESGGQTATVTELPAPAGGYGGITDQFGEEEKEWLSQPFPRTEPLAGAETVNSSGRDVTPETGGVAPQEVPPERRSRDSVGFSAPPHSQDRPTQETEEMDATQEPKRASDADPGARPQRAEAPFHDTGAEESDDALDYSSMEGRCRVAIPPAIDDRLIGEIDAAWLREHDLTLGAALNIVRLVVARASGGAKDARAMYCRGLLREARGSK